MSHLKEEFAREKGYSWNCNSSAPADYIEWLEAKVENGSSHNKQSTQNYACPKCKAWLSTAEYRTGECHTCHSTISA